MKSVLEWGLGIFNWCSSLVADSWQIGLISAVPARLWTYQSNYAGTQHHTRGSVPLRMSVSSVGISKLFKTSMLPFESCQS